jgi:very-short-patch-repair endonuclease
MENQATELEVIMRESLLENGFFFDEQVYVRKEQKHFQFDFVVYGEYCRVVVECDGPHHFQQEQRYKDSLRDVWTITHGFQDVLRFNRYQLRTEINNCIRKIAQTITKLDQALSHEQTRKEFINQEKEKIKNRTNSPFYIGEREKNPFTIERVKVSKKSSDEIQQKDKFRMLDESPSHFWFLESLRVESIKREFRRNSQPEQHREREKKLEISEEKLETMMETLTNYELDMLSIIIGGTSKDGYCVFHGSIESIHNLFSIGVIEINPFYRSTMREIGIRVLPNAHLLSNYFRGKVKSNKYQQETISKGTTSNYIKCSMNGCIAKIPSQKVIEWNGRCPRHNT